VAGQDVNVGIIHRVVFGALLNYDILIRSNQSINICIIIDFLGLLALETHSRQTVLVESQNTVTEAYDRLNDKMEIVLIKF